MKKEIHPPYHQTKITCACGQTLTIGSTLPAMQVEICAACHPFFTGNEKVLDSAGRVEKFKARAKKASR
ncbi:MAG: 50S ribosomal protein L31 [Candidatus Vogelbacteria bacterium CG10_big_fil_rev_8_21_14_0_10_49_38]|uniref:Large ribosomal subunit protein bL31 n=1 Tax=Candidatus Vogelbacteria bacterium CG10_big_fil_rev_8_21_14_0_10_49_38 TaxID=1975043 RepID=A0A2H0RHV0_9BACT|nr:MAG: 50S ribosomal protein L31 [bacterium CG10_49_38]PIR46078.1 MAG: 50S ribosomal protein L31 [Candidatus Vogelbacteria bacterium CG10_big_fil_rev_8_21_14_0_10_49_38]